MLSRYNSRNNFRIAQHRTHLPWIVSIWVSLLRRARPCTATLVVMASHKLKRMCLLRHRSHTTHSANKCLITGNLTGYRAMVICQISYSITRAKCITPQHRLIKHHTIHQSIRDILTRITTVARMGSSRLQLTRKQDCRNKEVRADLAQPWVTLVIRRASLNRWVNLVLAKLTSPY